MNYEYISTVVEFPWYVLHTVVLYLVTNPTAERADTLSFRVGLRTYTCNMVYTCTVCIILLLKGSGYMYM